MSVWVEISIKLKHDSGNKLGVYMVFANVGKGKLVDFALSSLKWPLQRIMEYVASNLVEGKKQNNKSYQSKKKAREEEV